ncbi:Uncharacterised protein [Acinetobacter baumannii]|nr:Uncharacterised protein [Acinetobacter baumannii]
MLSKCSLLASCSMVNADSSQLKVCSNTGGARNAPSFPHSARIRLSRCSRKSGSVMLKILKVDSVARESACSTSPEKYLSINRLCLLHIHDAVQQAILIDRVEPLRIEIADLAQEENRLDAIRKRICEPSLATGDRSGEYR